MNKLSRYYLLLNSTVTYLTHVTEFNRFTTTTPISVNAEHCKFTTRRFESKRCVVNLQCSALTEMGPNHTKLYKQSMKQHYKTEETEETEEN